MKRRGELLGNRQAESGRYASLTTILDVGTQDHFIKTFLHFVRRPDHLR
jgi:hypothetical protein